MSQDSVEIVADIYKRFSDGDLEGVLAHLSDDIEWVVPAATSFEPGVFHGHDGVLIDAERFKSAWSEITVDVLDLMAIGTSVVAWVRWRGLAARSRVPVEMSLGALWTLDGEKVTRFEHFPSGDEALAKLGPGPLKRLALRRRKRKRADCPELR